jgi:hypothetical protein
MGTVTAGGVEGVVEGVLTTVGFATNSMPFTAGCGISAGVGAVIGVGA